tara:strand:- start:395 stop:946 length:552 start_codon:yes stop_codon:yes gene_type:complete
MPLTKLQAEGLNLADTFAFSGTVSGAGGGKVLQVVQGTSNYSFSTTSSSYVDVESSSGTTWETAITPSATSSKILVQFNPSVTMQQNGASSCRGTLKIMEKIGSGSYGNMSNNSIQVQNMVGGYDYGGSGIQFRMRDLWSFLSSPNTTSECKYKLQVTLSGGATTYINDSSEYGTVILTEIGA